MKLVTKRIYEPASDDDGYRVLVDRLWPRGVSKVWARLDEWDKDIAPSTELRQGFGHDPAKFEEFSVRYTQELDANLELEDIVATWEQKSLVTLLYGAKDEAHNEAVVLRDYLTEKLSTD